MSSFITFLKGKKTHLIVGVLAIAYIVEALLGIDVPGVEVTADTLWEHLGPLLGLSTIRAGIAAK